MSDWSLRRLLGILHDDIEQKLDTARKSLGHPVAKGDSSEAVWLALLQTYLPMRYQATKAFIVDSEGEFSQQIDIVIYDRQYSPLIFEFQGETIIPAESVYAVFEAKQSINAAQVDYAQEKVASVRRLHRTSLPIPHAGGTYEAKKVQQILGGLLTFESNWSPALGQPLTDALEKSDDSNRLDIGCVAAHGIFGCGDDGCYSFTPRGKPATSFLFELIARLQSRATVGMIDVRAYARWLEED